jgi:hypothetical protein
MLVVLLAMLSAMLFGFGAGTAHAHGGPIEGQIAQDGEGGIYVSFSYVEDSHPVEALLVATVEGRSASGEVLEPVALVSASQGSGIWGTPPGTFPEGEWDVTVRVTDPIAYETSAPLEIVMADVVADDHVASAAQADGATGFSPWLGLGLGGVAVVAVVVLVTLMVLRRSRVSA